jgi:type II secretory pathway pseudopilin PulG
MLINGRQEGSLTLALLAAMIVGGLVLTLVATTITGTRAVRDDRSYQTAINGADAAMQQAVTYISQLPDGEAPACESGTPGNQCVLSLDFLGFDEQLGDGATLDWTATQINESRWELRGSGFVGDVERVIEADIAKDAFFTIGAFGDKGVDAKGGNGVISFNGSVSNTGRGAVGSNGEIRLPGNARADIAALFGPAVCVPNSNGCKPENITYTTFPDVFDVQAVYDAIETYRDANCTESLGTLTALNTTWEGGKTYCYTSIKTPKDSKITLSGASTDSPVLVFVDELLEFGRFSEINCSPTACLDDGTSKPETAALQIYSTGSEALIGGQGQYAFALAAPKADCKGNPSNSQAMIYGSMLCGDLSNQGGWNFAFDERLADLSIGAWRVTDWREEHPSTSSF